ncbi:MAG: hypothetical protein ACXV9P_15420, partial [Acidimicrobiia bacterium]
TLIEAVVESAFDSTSTDAALGAIDPTLPLEDRLIEAVEILRRRVTDLWQLRTALGMMQVSSGEPARSDRFRAPDLSALASVLVADRERIRRSPLEAAHLLRGLTVAGTHPALILDEPLSSVEIVSLFLDGIRAPHAPRPEASA